jgi:hypothetical protein
MPAALNFGGGLFIACDYRKAALGGHADIAALEDCPQVIGEKSAGADRNHRATGNHSLRGLSHHQEGLRAAENQRRRAKQPSPMSDSKILHPPRRNVLRLTGAILVAVLLPLVTAFLVWGEQFLLVGNPPRVRRADVVVVLAGGPAEDPVRVRAGTAMVGRGLAGCMLLPLRHKSLAWNWFVENYEIVEPIPSENVIIGKEFSPDDSLLKPGGTFAEARKTIEIMEQRHFSSAIVVTSGYHLRRARLAFKRVAGDQVFYFHPVPAGGARTRTWWMDGKYLLFILDEYRKLVAAYFVYG